MSQYDAPSSKQINYATLLATKAGYRRLDDAWRAHKGKASKVGGWKAGDYSDLIDWLQEDAVEAGTTCDTCDQPAVFDVRDGALHQPTCSGCLAEIVTLVGGTVTVEVL